MVKFSNGCRTISNRSRKILSIAKRCLSALAGKGCHENYFNVAWQNDNLYEAAGAYANSAGVGNSFVLAPNYPAGKDAIVGYKRTFKGETSQANFTQNLAKLTMLRRLHK